MKTALVLGAGGFIGSHLVKRLKSEGFWVKGVDLTLPNFSTTVADEFTIADLRKIGECEKIFDRKFDEIYQLAADMGGAGFVFSGENDADIMHNSALINLNVLNTALKAGCDSIFYSGSACMYPQYNQTDPDNPLCKESSAYPADPDSEYGWEKLFSERLYLAYNRNYGMKNSIARYHNIFGPEGAWEGGREKAPAAICRKVIQTNYPKPLEIWGDGLQTRSFLYIDECLEGSVRLMRSKTFYGPVNIGSSEMVSINKLAEMVLEIANKNLEILHIEGPLGVRGRNSDNKLIQRELSWSPNDPLYHGLEKTFGWILKQIETVSN